MKLVLTHFTLNTIEFPKYLDLNPLHLCGYLLIFFNNSGVLFTCYTSIHFQAILIFMKS